MTEDDAKQFVINCAIELLSTYEFHMTDVLDSNRRCVHHVNRVQLWQLQRAVDALNEVRDG